MREQEVVELELQELTNAMVRLYMELFGRGPTKARTDYAGRDTRTFFQHANSREFIDVVEQISGR